MGWLGVLAFACRAEFLCQEVAHPEALISEEVHMAILKDTLDVVKEAPSIINVIAEFARTHRFLASIAVSILVLAAIYQSSQALLVWTRWVRRTTWSWRAVALAGCLLVLGLSWLALDQLVCSLRPSPVHLQPAEHTTTWGHRVLLRWECPSVKLAWRAFEVQVRQGNITETYPVARNQYPFSPSDCRLKEGAFRWRVRAVKPPSNWSQWHETLFYKDRLSRIRKEGVLRVGLFADELPPYAYFSEYGVDNLDGIEVRLARLLARKLTELKLPGWPADIRISFVRNKWLDDGNVADLESGTTDIVLANTSGYREREEEFNILFSEHYLLTHLAFVWKKQGGVSSWTQLANKEVAIWEGSTAHAVLKTLDANPRHYESTTRMFEALRTGEVDAILDDERVLRCEAQNAAGEYEVQVFQLPAGVTLPFNYPEEICAYVCNDGSSASVLDGVNRVLACDDIKREIAEMVVTFANSPSGKPPVPTPEAQRAVIK